MSDHYCCKRCHQRFDECKCLTTQRRIEQEEDVSYTPKEKPLDMALITRARNELNEAQNTLYAMLDSPPAGLTNEELRSLVESRGRKMLLAARQLEAAIRGDRLTFRGA